MINPRVKGSIEEWKAAFGDTNTVLERQNEAIKDRLTFTLRRHLDCQRFNSALYIRCSVEEWNQYWPVVQEFAKGLNIYAYQWSDKKFNWINGRYFQRTWWVLQPTPKRIQ